MSDKPNPSSVKHKPITEAELKEMEENEDAGEAFEDTERLIAEVHRQRAALTSYAEVSNWVEVYQDGTSYSAFTPPHPDYRHADGYKLAREAIGWDPPDEPCDNPSCDGVKDDKTFGDVHRCFKDGRWLDDGSEM